MASQAKRVLLGQIANAHGLRGEVLVRSYTAAPENIAAYGPLSDSSGQRTLTLKVVRVTPKGVIARVAGVTDRNSAEALKGIELFATREALGEAGEGEYFYSDLIGLAAVSPDGKRVGTIKTVDNFGAGDLLEIALAGSSKTEYVPFKDAFVPAVDIAAGKVVVVMPADDGSRPEDEVPNATE